MSEVPQGENATFSFLDLITLALVLEAIPDFTHGKLLVGVVCLWLAYVNHAIGVRWQISRYLIPPAAITLLVYALLWCIDIRDTEMKYLAAGLVGAVILIAAVAAYSWIGKKGSAPLAAASPTQTTIPPLSNSPQSFRPADGAIQQPETKTPEKATVKPARKKPSISAPAKEGAKTTPPEAAKMVECGDGRFMPKASDCGVSNLTMRYNREVAPPDLSNTHKSSINNNVFSDTDKCGFTNSTVSNNVYRNGEAPDLSGNCNSRVDNNLVLGNGRPKLTVGGEENEITHNTFPQMDVETTDQSKRNKVRENLFQNPTTPGRVPTAKNGDGADTAKIRDAQDAIVTKCNTPCGPHGPYPDDDIEGVPSDLPLAKALHGSSLVVADQLSTIIDQGNAIVAAFVADNNIEALNKNQKVWQAKVDTAVSDLDPRLRDVLPNLKSKRPRGLSNHNQLGVSLCHSMKGEIDVLTIYQNQLRGVGD